MFKNTYFEEHLQATASKFHLDFRESFLPDWNKALTIKLPENGNTELYLHEKEKDQI